METQINTGTPHHENNNSTMIGVLVGIIILLIILFILFGRGLFNGEEDTTTTQPTQETATDSAN